MYEVAIRPIYFFKQEPFIAAILDVRTTRIIDRTVADLVQDGFSPVGHYVSSRVQKCEDPRIAPRPELVGRVTSVNAATLNLSDSKNNILSIEAKDVWLEKRAFAACLTHVFPGCDAAIASSLEKTRADLRQGPRLQRISTIVDFLASKQHWACPTVSFKFSPLLDDSSRRLFPSLETTPKPTYVFDQTGSKTDTWHDRDLDQYGPYTAKVFTPNRPKLCVICQKAHKGRVEQFLHKFINGIRPPPPSPSYRGKPQRNYFEKGLLRKYALQDVTYEFFVADDRSPNSYKEAWVPAHRFLFDRLRMHMLGWPHFLAPDGRRCAL